MNIYMQKQKTSLVYRILCGFVAFAFTSTMIVPPQVMAQIMPTTVLNLPVPGTMIPITASFTPAMMTGINLYPDNPLKFDFIVDKGETDLEGEEFKAESQKLIKYFLAALTTPEDQIWVNLSPYEKDRIIPDSFGETEMGRDLLAQDYLLKQLTASLMYPEDELGKKFWDRVYTRAQEEFGTTEIPMNTFNKIWIVPQKASVYEHQKGAIVVQSHLKVMLEEDYLALESNINSDRHGLGSVGLDDIEIISGVQSQIVKEILIPEIEREVNEGETFANLRQIYNSVILATWYKQSLKDSLLGQVYINQNKTKGINIEDTQINQKIYDQYVEAFEKGVYNYIKEDYDPVTQEVIPRKYFSGGAQIGLDQVDKESADSPVVLTELGKRGEESIITTEIDPIGEEIKASDLEAVSLSVVINDSEKHIQSAGSPVEIVNFDGKIIDDKTVLTAIEEIQEYIDGTMLPPDRDLEITRKTPPGLVVWMYSPRSNRTLDVKSAVLGVLEYFSKDMSLTYQLVPGSEKVVVSLNRSKLEGKDKGTLSEILSKKLAVLEGQIKDNVSSLVGSEDGELLDEGRKMSDVSRKESSSPTVKRDAHNLSAQLRELEDLIDYLKDELEALKAVNNSVSTILDLDSMRNRLENLVKEKDALIQKVSEGVSVDSDNRSIRNGMIEGKYFWKIKMLTHFLEVILGKKNSSDLIERVDGLFEFFRKNQINIDMTTLKKAILNERDEDVLEIEDKLTEDFLGQHMVLTRQIVEKVRGVRQEVNRIRSLSTRDVKGFSGEHFVNDFLGTYIELKKRILLEQLAFIENHPHAIIETEEIKLRPKETGRTTEIMHIPALGFKFKIEPVSTDDYTVRVMHDDKEIARREKGFSKYETSNELQKYLTYSFQANYTRGQWGRSVNIEQINKILNEVASSPIGLEFGDSMGSIITTERVFVNANDLEASDQQIAASPISEEIGENLALRLGMELSAMRRSETGYMMGYVNVDEDSSIVYKIHRVKDTRWRGEYYQVGSAWLRFNETRIFYRIDLTSQEINDELKKILQSEEFIKVLKRNFISDGEIGVSVKRENVERYLQALDEPYSLSTFLDILRTYYLDLSEQAKSQEVSILDQSIIVRVKTSQIVDGRRVFDTTVGTLSSLQFGSSQEEGKATFIKIKIPSKILRFANTKTISLKDISAVYFAKRGLLERGIKKAGFNGSSSPIISSVEFRRDGVYVGMNDSKFNYTMLYENLEKINENLVFHSELSLGADELALDRVIAEKGEDIIFLGAVSSLEEESELKDRAMLAVVEAFAKYANLSIMPNDNAEKEQRFGYGRRYYAKRKNVLNWWWGGRKQVMLDFRQFSLQFEKEYSEKWQERKNEFAKWGFIPESLVDFESPASAIVSGISHEAASSSIRLSVLKNEFLERLHNFNFWTSESLLIPTESESRQWTKVEVVKIVGEYLNSMKIVLSDDIDRNRKGSLDSQIQWIEKAIKEFEEFEGRVMSSTSSPMSMDAIAAEGRVLEKKNEVILLLKKYRNQLRDIPSFETIKSWLTKAKESGDLNKENMSFKIPSLMNDFEVFKVMSKFILAVEDNSQIAKSRDAFYDEAIASLERAYREEFSSSSTIEAKDVTQNPGGIDLNPNEIDMQLDRQNGVGLIMPAVTPAQVDLLRNVQGFIPIILNVAPVVNLPLLIGIDIPEEDNSDYSQDYELDPLDDRKARLKNSYGIFQYS